MKKHCEKHDAYYDDKKDVWLEGTCSDKKCSFCKNRPTKPSACSTSIKNIHPTKRPVQTDSGDVLNKDGNCSASSVKAKTGDLNLKRKWGRSYVA